MHPEHPYSQYLMVNAAVQSNTADREAIITQMNYLGTTDPDEALRQVDYACKLVGDGDLESMVNQVFEEKGEAAANWLVRVVNIATERKCPEYRDTFVTTANRAWKFNYK